MDRNIQSKFSNLTMGSTVLMTTNVGYKYEGVLIGYNSSELTITLKNVRFMGTDGQVIESNTENDAVKKLPAIGTSFKVVTFWITNVRKINTIEEAKVNSLIGDAAVKETTGIEENTLPIKPPVTNRDSTTVNTTAAQENNKERRPNRRSQTFTGNHRRGRNTENSRQPYIVYNAASSSTSAPNRSRFSVPVREAPVDGRFTRRSGMPNVKSRVPYTQPARNGGLILYLPPDLTSVYRSNGLNIMPQSNYKGSRNGGRRRNFERRNGILHGTSNQRREIEVDCSEPYDFEAANEELKVELSKIKLSTDGIDGQNTPSSGDRQAGSLSTENGISYNGKATDSGASGDSSTGITNAETETTANSDGIQSLSRGEYYVKEKCFFDQISRSEGGPRGPVNGGRGERGRLNHDNSRGTGRSGSANAISNARRERQLNIETFGPSATRSIYNQRRRPTGYVSRDILVSA